MQRDIISCRHIYFFETLSAKNTKVQYLVRPPFASIKAFTQSGIEFLSFLHVSLIDSSSSQTFLTSSMSCCLVVIVWPGSLRLTMAERVSMGFISGLFKYGYSRRIQALHGCFRGVIWSTILHESVISIRKPLKGLRYLILRGYIAVLLTIHHALHYMNSTDPLSRHY